MAGIDDPQIIQLIKLLKNFHLNCSNFADPILQSSDFVKISDARDPEIHGACETAHILGQLFDRFAKQFYASLCY